MDVKEEKSTHTLSVPGYRQTAVRLVHIGNKEGMSYFNAIPSIKTKLYRDGVHMISNVPESRLTPITSKPRRELQAAARQYAAGTIQGALEAGAITYYCERNGLTDLDNDFLVNELRKIIESLLPE